MFSGVYTALITPFKDGKIDYASLERIIEFQVQSGVAGIVSMGTTGESPTIPHDEHIEIIKKTAEIIKGRIHLMAGTGSNSTSEAIIFPRGLRRRVRTLFYLLILTIISLRRKG